MKKRWISLAALLCFGVCLTSGCKKDENGFKKLNIDGYDVVLKIGEDGKVYTANDFFKDMLNSKEGVAAAYEKLLKMIVENSVESNLEDIEASWDLLLESFEENVQSTATSSGISEDEAREQLLAEEGFATIEEKKVAYMYEIKLGELQEEFWNLRKDYYFEQYFNNRLPYYVKHVLVKVANGYDDSTLAPYATVITEKEAKNLYKVYEDLVNGEKFTDIMNVRSEDGGSKNGNGYMMDSTQNFASEFLYGVLSMDSLMKNTTSSVTGITSTANYYLNSVNEQTGEKDYNFNVIYASDIKALNDKASVGDTSSERNDISTFENDDEDKAVSVGSLKDGYGTSTLDTRTIIFNRTFNEPGISVIAYDLSDKIDGKYTELTINGEKKKVLTDEKGNVVFVVAARNGIDGDTSQMHIHFLTVDISPFDTFENTDGLNDAKLFFSIDKEKTIEEMVTAKKAELEEDGTLDEADNTQLTQYREKLNKYKTYVELNSNTVLEKNEQVKELEELVRTYAKRGMTSGKVSGVDEMLTYDMVEYYMKKGNVTIADPTIKSLIETYINDQRALIDLKTMNAIVGGWDDYYTKVTMANSTTIENKKIPLECAYGINAGASCSYNYDDPKGYTINITYKEAGTSSDSDAYMPTGENAYVKSFQIGDSLIELPKAGTSLENGMFREGYTFGGWYATSDHKGEAITHIDPSRSSTNNKVVLWAKWDPIPSE